jgi:hypothetical protein
MLLEYAENPTIESRAQQLWIMLTSLARNRQTTQYGIVADELGWAGAGTMGQFLAPILYFCRENTLPPLTVLVVNQDTGLPGAGYGSADDVAKSREQVFAFRWHDYAPPTTTQLKEAFDRGRAVVGA